MSKSERWLCKNRVVFFFFNMKKLNARPLSTEELFLSDCPVVINEFEQHCKHSSSPLHQDRS